MSGEKTAPSAPEAPPQSTKPVGSKPPTYHKQDTKNTVDRQGNKLEDNDSRQINDHLSSMGPEDQLQLRVNAQCFMMENIDMFTAWKPKDGYNKLFTVSGDPGELKQRLAARPGLGNFMQLTPHQMAQMIPYVDLYLVNTDNAGDPAGNGGSVEIKEKQGAKPLKVLLPGFTSEANIEAVFKNSSARCRGVALKEFYYEADGEAVGGNSNEVKQQRKVTMKFTAESLAAMGHRAPGFASVMDLAMTPTGELTTEDGEKVPNPNNFAVRVVFGWSLHPESRGHFSGEQIAAIDGSAESMILYSTALPKVTMSEDGTVDLEVEYISKIEINKNAQDRNINVLADTGRGNWQEKTGGAVSAKQAAAGKLRKVLTEVKATLNPEGQKHFGLQGDIPQDFKGVDLDKFTGTGGTGTSSDDYEDETYGDAQTKNSSIDHDNHSGEEFLKDDAFKSAGGKDGVESAKRKQAHRQLADKASRAVKDYRAAAEKADALQAGNRNTKWSAPLSHLLSAGKIHTVYVEKEALGVEMSYGTAYDMVKVSARPKVPPYSISDPAVQDLVKKAAAGDENAKATLKQWKEDHKAAYGTADGADGNRNIKDREGVVKPVSAGSQAAYGDTTAYFDHVNAVIEQTKAAKSGDEDKKEKADEALSNAQHTTGYLKPDPSGKYLKLHYIYLGDIVDFALMQAFYRSPRTEPHPNEALFMMGDIQFRDFYRPSRINNTNLSDIPIGLELYKDWLMKTIVGPQIDHMDLKTFLNKILMDLVIPAFGAGGGGQFAQGCASSPEMYGPARPDNALTYEAFEGRTDQKGKCRVRKKAKTNRIRVQDVDLRKKPNDAASLDSRNHAPVASNLKYVVVHAQAISQTELFGNKETDQNTWGIYHIGMGTENGPVLSTTFEAMDDEQFESIVAEGDRSHYEKVGLAASGISRRPQKSVVKMFGNNLFELGRKFFIDITSVGSPDDFNYARALGFGGYYQNIKTYGTISDKGWVMTIEGYPTMEESKNFTAARKIFLDSRDGLFTENDQKTVPSKTEAVRERSAATATKEDTAAKTKEEKAAKYQKEINTKTKGKAGGSGASSYYIPPAGSKMY